MFEISFKLREILDINLDITFIIKMLILMLRLDMS